MKKSPPMASLAMPVAWADAPILESADAADAATVKSVEKRRVARVVAAFEVDFDDASPAQQVFLDLLIARQTEVTRS